MTPNTSDPSAKAGAGVLLPCERRDHTRIRSETQRYSDRSIAEISAEAELARASVSVSIMGGGAFMVRLHNPPWGWGILDRECFSQAIADRYAHKLRERLRVARQQEAARLALRHAAKRRTMRLLGGAA